MIAVADFFKEKLKRKLSCSDEGLIPSPTRIKSLIETTASVPLKHLHREHRYW